MSRLRLSLACYDSYDRTRPLLDGTVQPDGIDLIPIRFPIGGELHRRVVQDAEFDIAELSTSSYMALTSRGDERFVGIPVFPSRNFRHAFVFIDERSGITQPEDLAGKRVGVPEYQMTAALWIRSALQDDYGVSADQIEWFEGGMNTYAEPERLRLELPEKIRLHRIADDQNLSDMLDRGELDAVLGAGEPRCFRRSPNVSRLFRDYRRVERDYYKRTGFFPIMHMVVIRRDLYSAHRWVAQSVMQAFEQAKALGLRRIQQTGVLPVAVPWLMAELEEMREVFGPDPWPYGISGNAKVLERMTRASFEQGLSRQQLEIRELFAPETWRS